MSESKSNKTGNEVKKKVTKKDVIDIQRFLSDYNDKKKGMKYLKGGFVVWCQKRKEMSLRSFDDWKKLFIEYSNS